ncbi:hypothetical protein EYC80_004941 [Monilinia laxa]|uniref:Uncharacterized protein n=1 Tax=Monilinia laxa TaxID=61186 RepID=A0A5N6KIV6_MONLA|nr:hypothetical protein EYC80_004941 [Monilinia laxa]
MLIMENLLLRMRGLLKNLSPYQAAKSNICDAYMHVETPIVEYSKFCFVHQCNARASPIIVISSYRIALYRKKGKCLTNENL